MYSFFQPIRFMRTPLTQSCAGLVGNNTEDVINYCAIRPYSSRELAKLP